MSRLEIQLSKLFPPNEKNSKSHAPSPKLPSAKPSSGTCYQRVYANIYKSQKDVSAALPWRVQSLSDGLTG